jgi:glycosyltransferase involved in cell wall biosynthesis
VTPAFRGPLAEYRVPDENIAVIPNWAPLDEIVPVERRNPWALEHGLADELVFLYAGALGIKHDPALLMELAQTLPATVVVVSEGGGADAVKAEAARRQLDNVRVLPVQPYQRLSEVLGSADVLVATLDRQGSAHSVPSKVLSYLCAERPILAIIPRENLAATVVAESGGGVVVQPDDLRGTLAAARQLAGNETQRREFALRGRAYAKRTFDIRRIGDEFEAVLARASAARK